MPQQIIVTENGRTTIIPTGPVGPQGPRGIQGVPGNGLTGPLELLPLPISRMVPWSAWTQFDGIPLGSFQMGSLAFTLAFPSAPLQVGLFGTLGNLPILSPDGGPLNLRVSACIGSLFHDYDEDGELYLKVSGTWLNMNTHEWSEGVFGEFPLLYSHQIGVPTASTMSTSVVEFDTTEETALVYLQIDVLKVSNDLPPTLAHGVALFLNNVSMYSGSTEEEACIDANAPQTHLGMSYPTLAGARFMTFGRPWATSVHAGGIDFAHRLNNPDGSIELDTSSTYLRAEMDEDLDRPYLETTSLRVLSPAEVDNDVVRKADLDTAIIGVSNSPTSFKLPATPGDRWSVGGPGTDMSLSNFTMNNSRMTLAPTYLPAGTGVKLEVFPLADNVGGGIWKLLAYPADPITGLPFGQNRIGNLSLIDLYGQTDRVSTVETIDIPVSGLYYLGVWVSDSDVYGWPKLVCNVYGGTTRLPIETPQNSTSAGRECVGLFFQNATPLEANTDVCPSSGIWIDGPMPRVYAKYPDA